MKDRNPWAVGGSDARTLRSILERSMVDGSKEEKSRDLREDRSSWLA